MKASLERRLDELEAFDGRKHRPFVNIAALGELEAVNRALALLGRSGEGFTFLEYNMGGTLRERVQHLRDSLSLDMEALRKAGFSLADELKKVPYQMIAGFDYQTKDYFLDGEEQ